MGYSPGRSGHRSRSRASGRQRIGHDHGRYRATLGGRPDRRGGGARRPRRTPSRPDTDTAPRTGLPAGLSISASSGLISGTPSAAGTYSVTVTAKDTTGASGSASFTWTISSSGTTCTSTAAVVGNPFTGVENNDNNTDYVVGQVELDP